MTISPAKLDTLDEHPSEDGLEVHPAVQLLIARMESHPQEFYRYNPKTPTTTSPNGSKVTNAVTQALEHTKGLWNRKEKRLFNMALRKVRLEEFHVRLMAALLTEK